MPNPNKIDVLRYQDIQVPDIQLRTEFNRRVSLGQYQEALNLLDDNKAQLKGKAYIAETINKIVSGIYELEDKFNQGVLVYLSDLAMKFSDLIDNMNKAGVWTATKQYEPYNFVVYNQEIYMCFDKPPIGAEVSDTTYWIKLGLKGEKGASGVNITNKYEWNNSTTYEVNDLVAYKNNIYVALTKNTGSAPDSSTNNWLMFLSYEQGQIYIGINPPNNPVENMIWFHTDSDISNSPANVPVYGYFKHYTVDGAWEEMYPNTVYEMVSNVDQYAYPLFVQMVTINTSDWVGNRWTYVYPNLTQDSIVDILPSPPLDEMQDKIYNSLSISIEGQNIVLIAKETPTTTLNVRIRIIR